MDELSSVCRLRERPTSKQYFWVSKPGHCMYSLFHCYLPLRLLMQKVDSRGSVKDSLDTMLKQWKPKHFKPTKVHGMAVRVRCLHCYMPVMNP